MGLAFFGLTYDVVPQVRYNLFRQIHEICFHGKGGYDWNTVYDMPIWLRKFTFHEINEFYKKENESVNSSTGNSKQTKLINEDGKVNTPEFLKASEQYKKPAKYK